MTFKNVLTLTAALSVSLVASCSGPKLNQVIVGLPATPEYSRPIKSYSVQEMAKLMEPVFADVEVSSDKLTLARRPLRQKVPGGYRESQTFRELEHNGSRLTGRTSLSHQTKVYQN